MELKDLVGAWDLHEYRMVDKDGRIVHPWGPKTRGLILYTAEGYMSVTIDVEDLATGKMAFQAASARVEVAGDRLVHKIIVASTASIVGTDQHRRVKIENGLYYLTATPSLYGGPGTSVDLIWRRATARG